MQAWRVPVILRPFCGVAVLCCLSVGWMPTSLPPDLTWAVVLLVLFLGVPHGALDPVLAGGWLRDATPRRWAAFLVTYCLLAAAAVALWWWSPALFLLGFLLMSAHHFSEDLPASSGSPRRLLHGASVILLPALLHDAEMIRLLLLIAPQTPPLALQALQWLAWPCALLALFEAGMALRAGSANVLPRIFLLCALVLLPPLVSFALYFCLWHAPLHVLRLRERITPWPAPLVAASLVCAVLTVGAAAAGWWWLGWQAFPALVVTSLFVGLGALTLPHWLLVRHFLKDTPHAQ